MTLANYNKLARWLCFYSQNSKAKLDCASSARTSTAGALAVEALEDVERLLAKCDEEAFHELAALRTRYNTMTFSMGENDNTAAHPFQTD